MAAMLGIPFILECLTASGPLYVQHLNTKHRVRSLTDNPALALAFLAQACQCDEAYFVIVPPLHGSVWEVFRPVAILPRPSMPETGLWITWPRRLLTFAKAMSTALSGRLAAPKACGLCLAVVHEAMGTAPVEAKKSADKDFTQVYLHGRCPVAMTNDVRHQPVIRVVQHDTPKERAWPSDADRRSV
jgi:hypothetical protein